MAISHYNIAIKANQLRDNMTLGAMGIVDIFKLLESRGYKIFRYPLGKDTILGASALYGNDKVIITNSSYILAREIFTVAHELGHHELHLCSGKSGIIDTEKDIDNDEKNIESEANYFAATFLMPKHLLCRYVDEVLKKPDGNFLTGLDIARIQSEFNVSFEAAIERLRAVNIICLNKKMELREEKVEKTARTLIKSISGNENLLMTSNAKSLPAEYLDMVISNYENKLVPDKSVEKIMKYFEIEYIKDDHENVVLEERKTRGGR